jgi:hypothetical protein
LQSTLGPPLLLMVVFFRQAAVEALGGLVQSGNELPGSSLSLPHQMGYHPCGKKCRQRPLLICADRYGSMGYALWIATERTVKHIFARH